MATVDVRSTCNNDLKLVKTRTVQTIKSSSRFDRINKFDRDYSYWQILFIVCPPEKPRDIANGPSILRRMQRWRVSWIRSIVNEQHLYLVALTIFGVDRSALCSWIFLLYTSLVASNSAQWRVTWTSEWVQHTVHQLARKWQFLLTTSTCLWSTSGEIR